MLAAGFYLSVYILCRNPFWVLRTKQNSESKIMERDNNSNESNGMYEALCTSKLTFMGYSMTNL